jgi:hypothetical protein
MSLRIIVALVIGGFAILSIFAKARERAVESPQSRSRVLVRSSIGLAIGLAIAVWLPYRVPKSMSESPAGIVLILLEWVVGGGLALASLVSIAGVFAQPASEK